MSDKQDMDSSLSAAVACVSAAPPRSEVPPALFTVPTDENGRGPLGTKWCQPAHHADDRVWILRFEDADRGDAIFTGPDAEAQAREMWARAWPSWNCYLFATAPWPPAQPSGPEPAGWRDISTAPIAETVLVAGGDADYPVTASWTGLHDECWCIDGQSNVHDEIGWPTHWMPLPDAPYLSGGEQG